jgi:endonuclease-3
MHESTSTSVTSSVTTPDDGITSESSTSQPARKRKRAVSTKVKVETNIPESITSPPRKRREPAKVKKTPDANGNIVAEPPSHWQEMFNTVKTYRLAHPTTPVDTMGCERLADPNDSPCDQRFQTLISLMLSSQTKDQVTAAAIRAMQQELPGGLNLESILAVSPERLNTLIGKVGFHNTKTKNIKRAAEILRDEWESDIPSTAAGLISLPGVGPKMAYLTLSAAWGITDGIGVDVHVHRITNIWGWHRTTTPEQTRLQLQAWLPREHWHEINWLLVGFGQTVCMPVKRLCGECVLGTRGMCPAAKVVKKGPAKVEIGDECAKVEYTDDAVKDEESVDEIKDEIMAVKSEEKLVDIEDLALLPTKLPSKARRVKPAGR